MKAILVLIAALAFAITPFLSPEFGGFDPNLYPMPQDDPPVQPAGWAFSIWVRWSRLSEQQIRIAKWIVCRGYAAVRIGSSVK